MSLGRWTGPLQWLMTWKHRQETRVSHQPLRSEGALTRTAAHPRGGVGLEGRGRSGAYDAGWAAQGVLPAPRGRRAVLFTVKGDRPGLEEAVAASRAPCERAGLRRRGLARPGVLAASPGEGHTCMWGRGGPGGAAGLGPKPRFSPRGRWTSVRSD